MEELQVIETTSGRQFKPWATKDDVQDPTSVTAIASEIASGKQAIASAINAKGGTASSSESFIKLAQDIEDMSQSLINQGLTTTEPFSFLKFFCSNATPERVILTDIDDNSVELINVGYCFAGCLGLRTVRMSALSNISASNAFRGLSALTVVDVPALLNIAVGSFYDCTSLREAYMPIVKTLSGGTIFNGCTALKTVTFGAMTTSVEPFGDAKLNLRNITVGLDTNVNLQFQQWTATNVIAEGQSGIDELNSNLQTNLIAKLYQGGGKILRLGATLYDVTTQETRDMVTAKGWTLQRG